MILIAGCGLIPEVGLLLEVNEFMAKSILCVIDFSESSLNALKYAADLSARYQSHLTVLYPYRLLSTSKDDVAQIKKKNEDLAIHKFESLENDYLNGKVTSFDFTAEVGFLPDRVEDHLRKTPVQFLVIGKHMNSAYQENLDKLLKQVTVPLVVVP